MPRRQTLFVPGCFYHLYNRGNNRQTIFFEPDNYLYFLRGVHRYLTPVLDILAYCLMPTHYHLLVRVREAKTSEVSSAISKAMMRLAVSYTKAINKRFDRVGALFQGAFQAKLVTADAHLRHLCIYIHANPVKDGLVADPADWPYSNYLEWIGVRDGRLADRRFIREMYPHAPEQAHRKAVFRYLKTRALPEEIRLYLETFE